MTVAEYDVVIVGGGTAGCLLASRLADQKGIRTVLLEAGPSDVDEPRARSLRRWDEMVGSEYDLDYLSVPQERGNSGIHQTRTRLLGGCSTTNTMIAWRPLASDLRRWQALGATGWGPEEFEPYFDRLRTPIVPVAEQDRNPMVQDVITSAENALDLPATRSWNDGHLDSCARGTGFFEVGYTPATNERASTSIHYLHGGHGPGLEVLTEARVARLVVGTDDGGRPRTTGVVLVDGREIRATREVVLCAGAIDTVALLQRSGIGPATVLEDAGIPVVLDRPGVGENLQDHAEGLVVWEVDRDIPATCASGWDAGAMLELGEEPGAPDVLMHFPVEAWVEHPRRNGWTFPADIVAIAPNVARPASRGRVWVTASDPDRAPAIDYRYFTDPDGHDEAMLVGGVRAARRIAEAEPMRSWVVREVFPGAEVRTDADLSRVQRANHQTVYHVSGTCRIGAPEDPLAVVDPELRVIGIDGLRIADASVMPTLTATNPVVTIMMIAEKAADLLASTSTGDLRGQELPG